MLIFYFPLGNKQISPAKCVIKIVQIGFVSAYGVPGYVTIFSPFSFQIDELDFFEVKTGLRFQGSEHIFRIEESHQLYESGVLLEDFYFDSSGELVLIFQNEYEQPHFKLAGDSLAVICYDSLIRTVLFYRHVVTEI